METIAPINLETNSEQSESNEQEQQPSISLANEKKMYKCRVKLRNDCQAEFNSFKLLNQHMKTEHREIIENKVFKCKYCDERIIKKLWQKHIKTEHSECKFEGCNVRLPLLTLKVHQLHEHDNGETKKKKAKNKVNKCRANDCNRTFSTHKDLREHVKNDHKNEKKNRPRKFEGCDQSFGPLDITKEHRKDFEMKCKICNFICNSKSGWRKHRKMHIQAIFKQHDDESNGTLDKGQGGENVSRTIYCVLDECEEQMKPKEMNSHLIKFHGIKFSCYLCKMWQRSKDRLRAHFKQHIIPAMIGPKCRHCGRKFPDKKSWRKHKRTVHSKKFKCKMCDKKFYTKNPFKDHMKDKHPDVNNSNEKVPDVALN